MIPRLAIYARVSTTNHGQDVSVQTLELEQFGKARGWHTVDTYVDAGVSGAKDSRPELNRLMADAHKRRFDVVVVWRFDRFARSVSHLLRALETFNALGIAFVSLSEQMDTTTPTGKMVFTVREPRASGSGGRARLWTPVGLPVCAHRGALYAKSHTN
jgi:DNA invertase Pin-like site-specific DNA recombinase